MKPLSLFTFASALLIGALPAVAETIASTWSLDRTSGHSSADVDDLSGHHLALTSFLLRPTAGDRIAGRRITEVRCAEVTDALPYSAFPTGYCTALLQGGERLFTRYQGEYRRSRSPRGDWRLVGSGEWQALGGTGPFEKASGGGQWEASGAETAAGLRTGWTLSVEGEVHGAKTP